MAGLAPSGPSGMRDYGHLLAEELRRQGMPTGEMWLDNDGIGPRQAIVSAVRFLQWGWGVGPDTVVVWHYSPFAYALRGVPLPGVLLGVLLRARRVPVVTVLHELAYPWGRHGIAGRIFAATQRAALAMVVAGSASMIVTTKQRASSLRRLPWSWTDADVHVVPVFSTISPHPLSRPSDGEVIRLGVIGYGSDGAMPELLFAALRQFTTFERLRIVLLGAPGAESREGRRWMALARAAGVEDVLEFTGVLSEAELSAQLRHCRMITLLDEEGPTSRRTMLAAALAHGCPVVAVDGPNRWEDAAQRGAFLLVPPDPVDLGRVFRSLLEDLQELAAMSARAATYYEQEMSLQRAAEAVATVIRALPTRLS